MWRAVLGRFVSTPQPTIAVVDRQVTVGSLGFLLVTDIVLLSPTAEITPYYPVLGFSPDEGWTALLPSIVGPKRTSRIL